MEQILLQWHTCHTLTKKDFGDGKDIFIVKVHEGKYTRNIYLDMLIVVVCESVCEGVLGMPS